MFAVGDLIIYSGHGVCRIDNISVKSFSGVSRNYYDLHPLNGNKLKISIPVDNKSVLMLDLIHRDEAEKIIESFRLPGIRWIDHNNERYQMYSNIVNSGNRKEIAKVANTLMRKKQLAEMNNKKLGARDQDLLTSIESILFNEIAISFESTYDDILDKVNCKLNENQVL